MRPNISWSRPSHPGSQSYGCDDVTQTPRPHCAPLQRRAVSIHIAGVSSLAPSAPVASSRPVGPFLFGMAVFIGQTDGHISFLLFMAQCNERINPARSSSKAVRHPLSGLTAFIGH